MKTTSWVFFTLVFFLIFSACQKEFIVNNEEIITNNNPFPIPAASPVTGSVAGSVVDENNEPVANAEVTIGNATYHTNDRGFFSTQQLMLDKYITTVKVNKQGYFKAYRSFSANATKNYVSIKLIPKTLSASFSSTTAGAVNLSNGTQVSFQANSIVIKSSGAPYSGTVNVYCKYIDPTANDIVATVPGSFIGKDGNNMYCLKSTGMLATELESSTGEALQLAAGRPASVKMGIPSSLQGNAPSSIATWSLNEQGVWIKEGIALRNGNVYDMQVSHFSFWNCDVPIDAVYLSMNIKDHNSNSLTNTVVSLQVESTYNMATGITDSLGNVSGMVPANEVLTMRVTSSPYSCSTPLVTQNIGPFTANTNLNLNVTVPPQQMLSITGSAVNCSGANVTNGTAIVYANNKAYYISIANGNFAIDIAHCDPIAQIEIIAVDHITQQESIISTLPVNGTAVNTGTLQACGAVSLEEFIHYTLDGVDFSITSTASDSLYAAIDTSIYATRISGTACCHAIVFSASDTSVGSSTAAAVYFRVNQYYLLLNTSGSTNVTFTTYGNVGQYIEGNFNIPFRVDSSNHIVNGNFRIRRSRNTIP